VGARIWSLANSPDGKIIVVGTDTGLVKIIRTSDMAIIEDLMIASGFSQEGFSTDVISVSFSSDGKYLAVGHAKGFKLFGPFN